MTTIYKILFLAISSLVVFNFKAQSNDWELYRSVDGVELFTMKVNCKPKKGGFDRDLILIKVVNTNNVTKSISWKEALWYNDNCFSCNSNSNEFLKEFSLFPNSQIIGECEGFDYPFLTLFVQFTDKDYKSQDVQILTKFELRDLRIK